MNKLETLIVEELSKTKKATTEALLTSVVNELEGVSPEAQLRIKEIIQLASEAVIKDVPELGIAPEALAEAVADATPEVIEMPESLVSLFADAKAPSEEEIANIQEAVENDKIAKTVGTVNEALVTAKIEGSVDAKKLAEIKDFVNPAIYAKVVEGDAEALEAIKKLLIVEEKNDDDNDDELGKKSVLAGFKKEEEKPITAITPDEIYKRREEEFNTIVKNYEDQQKAAGLEGNELETKVKAYSKALLDSLKDQIQ